MVAYGLLVDPRLVPSTMNVLVSSGKDHGLRTPVDMPLAAAYRPI